VVLGTAGKKLLLAALLVVASAVGFTVGATVWEEEPATERDSKPGEPAIRAE
jgi:hypothetical protein